MDASEQRRLPKKRLLQSFHLEEAAERETYNSQGESKVLEIRYDAQSAFMLD